MRRKPMFMRSTRRETGADCKDSAAKEISTANEASVTSNRGRQFRNRSQVAVSHRRKPKASCNRAGNGDGNGLVVQKWITRAAIRKNGPLGQIAKAFCQSRQLNRSPAHGVSHSGFCGCQRGAILLDTGKRARLIMSVLQNRIRTSFGNGNSGQDRREVLA